MSRLIGWVAGFAFLAAGAGTWWHTHSWWKTALVTLALGILALGKKIWVEIESKWVKIISDRMNLRLTIWSSRFKKRYVRYLRNSYAKADFQGFRAQGEFALDLEAIYVDQLVEPAVFESIPQNPVLLPASEIGGGRHALLGWLQAKTTMNFAIIGAPGIGKTTLLKHLTLLSIREEAALPWVPVLLFLRDHADTIAAAPSTSLVDLLEANLKDLEPPAGWFREQLKRGKLLVMLDGLDEIADLTKRKDVARWVGRQVAFFGGSRFLVSSRPNGYKESRLSGFNVLRVLNFNREQTEFFVRSWYIASESQGMKLTPEAQAKATTEAEQLLAELHDAPALAELAVNPLLLTLIATVHRNLHRLPGSRVELFAEICELFLGKLQEERGLVSEIAPLAKMKVLELLAYQMMCRERDRIEADEAANLIGNVLQSIKPGDKPAAFLKMVEDSSSLLVQPEAEVYGFPHRSFQEFLASRYIKRQNLGGQLVANIDQAWWYETTLFYAAQADATPILEACLASPRPTVDALLLATDLETYSPNIKPDLQERLRSVTVTALDDADPERRRLAAEYLLARRVRRMTWIDNDRDVDTSPVSHAEYQLFVDESWSQGDSRQPEHWNHYEFVLGQGGTPVEGIRKEDAEAFCRWLTEKRPGRWRYQLPESQILKTASKGQWTPDDFFAFDEEDAFLSLSGREMLDQIELDMVRMREARDTTGTGRIVRRLGWFRLWLGQYVDVRATDTSRVVRSALAGIIRHDVDLYNILALERMRDLDTALRRALRRDRGLDRGIDYAIRRVTEQRGIADTLTRTGDRSIEDLDRTVSFHDLGAGIARDLALSLAEILPQTLSRRATRQIADQLVQELDHERGPATVHDLSQPRMMVAWLCWIEKQAQGGAGPRKKLWIARESSR